MEETHDEQDPSSRGVYGATGALRDVLEAWCPPEADPWKCNHGESRDTFAIRVAGLIERRESALGRPSGLTIEGLWSQAMKAESEAFRRRRGTREDFWLVASEAWQRGWQVVPQDRDAKRLPGLIRGGGRVRWGGIHDAPPDEW